MSTTDWNDIGYGSPWSRGIVLNKLIRAINERNFVRPAQKEFLVPAGTIEAGDLFTVTLFDESLNQASVSVAAASSSVSVLCAAIVGAFGASPSPLFHAITASSVGT